jgi:transposase-like protein
MKEIAAIVEYDTASVKREIATAWKNCKQAEKYGLKFGEVCFEWQRKLKTSGGVGNKGKGIVATLQQLSIPERTAYRWINLYKESIGLKESKAEKPEYETPPEHLRAVHELREWMESEIPDAAKRICIKPCGFGYESGMGQDAKPGEIPPSFDLELRNLTIEEVKKIGKYIEDL